MSFSIYYSAERKQAITDEERKNVESIVNRYNTEYPFKRKTEDFCVYDSIDDENIIFSGAVKLPGGGYKTMYAVAQYWLKCLTEITGGLNGCNWDVHFDDVDLILDADGWRFPTDEEYAQRKNEPSD